MTSLERVPLPSILDGVDAVVRKIRESIDTAELQDARANIEAAKAYAKAQGLAAEARDALFVLEVETFARIAQLDALEILPPHLRKEAKFLGDMTTEFRAAFMSSAIKRVSAAAAVRALWESEKEERERNEGNAFAAGPKSTTTQSPPNWNPTRMAEWIFDSYLAGDRSFTVDEFADALAATSGAPVSDGFREGVREMCRHTIRTAHAEEIGGTVIPKTITALTDEGGWVRIPTMNATVGHAVVNLDLKTKQTDDMIAARDRFARFVDRLIEVAGEDLDMRIEDVLVEMNLGGE